MHTFAFSWGTLSLSKVQPILRRAAYSRATLIRNYASTTQGTPNATNLGTPSPKPSDSPQEGDVKSSQATGDVSQESGSSVAKPVKQDNLAGKQQNMDDEGGDPAKNDPNKPAEEKRKETLEAGKKPLDAANK